MQLCEKKNGKEKKYIPLKLDEEALPWGFKDSQSGVIFIPRRRRYITKEKIRIEKYLLHIEHYLCNYIFFS